MTDIARIAGVTRQAVTNWRSRPAVIPFPSSVARGHGSMELFDRDEVLDWLDGTGRGRDGDARLDAPAVAVPDGLDIDRAVVLLALRAAASRDVGPLSAAERVAWAEEVDPDDRYLLSEVRVAADDDALAVYADGLLEASYGPSDALARLYDSRAARGGRGLSRDLIDLLAQIADVCRVHLGPDGVDIALQAEPRARRIAAGFAAADPACDRSMLRLLALEGLPVGSGSGPRVRVVSVAGRSDAAVLAAADDIAVDLGPDEIAIVLGPASALCDRLNPAGDLYATRKGSLQMGGRDYGCALAAAVRLPRGMWRDAHRQSLGLWVLQGATTSGGVVVADLSGRDIDAAELAADVLGALERTGARAYRYGRILPYNDVWTRDTVVPAGVGAAVSARVAGRSTRDRLAAATLVTREDVRGFDVPLASGGAGTPGAPRALGTMIRARTIVLQSGSRISDDHTDPDGSIRILTATPSDPVRGIDPLVAADHYGHATRTEPGDVVFTATPAPRAVVDEIGGALVASPSRILRLDPARAGIGPRALAAAINAMADSSEWRTWPVPSIPAAQISRLEDTLGGALDHLAILRRHRRAAEDVVTHLIRGVADGSVALSAPTPTKAG